MMVYTIEFMPTYLKYKYIYFFHFELRSDPDPRKKVGSSSLMQCLGFVLKEKNKKWILDRIGIMTFKNF